MICNCKLGLRSRSSWSAVLTFSMSEILKMTTTVLLLGSFDLHHAFHATLSSESASRKICCLLDRTSVLLYHDRLEDGSSAHVNLVWVTFHLYQTQLDRTHTQSVIPCCYHVILCRPSALRRLSHRPSYPVECSFARCCRGPDLYILSWLSLHTY